MRQSGGKLEGHLANLGRRLRIEFRVVAAHHGLAMKSLTKQLWFEVSGRRGFVNITDTVEDLVVKSGVQEGLCLVNAMHITASVFINDNESGLRNNSK